ncbi:MAG: hypothetical protein ACPHK8_05170 [Thermoplasmatota archaeon]
MHDTEVVYHGHQTPFALLGRLGGLDNYPGGMDVKIPWIWLLVALYVISPIDLDPGMPFTDIAAIAGAILYERRNKK